MTETPELIPADAGMPSREGLYVCGACGRVATPSQREIDLSESSPGAVVDIKCMYCRRWAVRWHPPARARIVARDAQGARLRPAVDADQAAVRFAQIKASLNQ